MREFAHIASLLMFHNARWMEGQTQLALNLAPPPRRVPATGRDTREDQRAPTGAAAAGETDRVTAAPLPRMTRLERDPIARLQAQARTSDPSSSHAAADRVERDGIVQSHAQRILAVVEAAPGLTAKQIAFEAGLTHEQVARRLPKMQELGLLHRPKRDAEHDDGSPLQVFPGPVPA